MLFLAPKFLHIISHQLPNKATFTSNNASHSVSPWRRRLNSRIWKLNLTGLPWEKRAEKAKLTKETFLIYYWPFSSKFWAICNCSWPISRHWVLGTTSMNPHFKCHGTPERMESLHRVVCVCTRLMEHSSWKRENFILPTWLDWTRKKLVAMFQRLTWFRNMVQPGITWLMEDHPNYLPTLVGFNDDWSRESSGP